VRARDVHSAEPVAALIECQDKVLTVALERSNVDCM
jgi:hypothetical protein